ncbi:hypothetical protein [Aliterella atlantica]|uniref:hypothetical protein n=1 Tax=Aliterella atlantica TaxID=1827278 RepID=UPI00118526B5|nr:hypothetical protein [Aliterella atlantica]
MNSTEQRKITWFQSHLQLLGRLLLGLIILAIWAIASISLGAVDLPLPTIYDAVTAFDGSYQEHLIVRIRLHWFISLCRFGFFGELW